MNKTAKTQAPAPTAPDDEPGNTNIDNMDALNGDREGAGVVMKGLGVERCRAALAGMKAQSVTTTGLIQALAVCTEFVRDHIDGGGITRHCTLALEKDEPGFDQLAQLTRDARDLQTTTRNKRRLAIVEGQSC